MKSYQQGLGRVCGSKRKRGRLPWESGSGPAPLGVGGARIWDPRKGVRRGVPDSPRRPRSLFHRHGEQSLEKAVRASPRAFSAVEKGGVPPAVSFLAASPPLRCGCLLPNFGGSTSSPREPWRGWLRAGGGEGGWRLPQLGERAEGGMAPRGRGRPRGVRGEPAPAGPLLPSGCTCPPGRGCWGARGPHPAAGRCATSFRFKLI